MSDTTHEPQKDPLADSIGGVKKTFKDPEDLGLIETWERDLIAIQVSEAFLKFPETQRLRDLAEKSIATMNEILQENQGLTPEDQKLRFEAFAARRIHRAYLAFLSPDNEMRRKNLQAEVDEATGGASEN